MGELTQRPSDNAVCWEITSRVPAVDAPNRVSRVVPVMTGIPSQAGPVGPRTRSLTRRWTDPSVRPHRGGRNAGRPHPAALTVPCAGSTVRRAGDDISPDSGGSRVPLPDLRQASVHRPDRRCRGWLLGPDPVLARRSRSVAELRAAAGEPRHEDAVGGPVLGDRPCNTAPVGDRVRERPVRIGVRRMVIQGLARLVVTCA